MPDKKDLVEPDLTHADWVLETQTNLIQKIDPSIHARVVKRNGKRLLILSEISEESLPKLQFIANNDKNNNYLYIEQFLTYIESKNTPLNIPGLFSVIRNSYNHSDSDSFISGSTTFTPFTPNYFKGLSFSQFIDKYTALLPYTKNTTGIRKKYTIVLNPDHDYTNGNTPNSTAKNQGPY